MAQMGQCYEYGSTPCFTTMYINISVLHVICYLHNTVAQKIVVIWLMYTLGQRLTIYETVDYLTLVLYLLKPKYFYS
jgi:hypothetical protein